MPMLLHVETALDRPSAVAKANDWMKTHLKAGQFYNAIMNPLLQVTVDIESKGIFKRSVTKRLVYDYSVLIYYFSEEEMTMAVPIPDEGTAVKSHFNPIG